MAMRVLLAVLILVKASVLQAQADSIYPVDRVVAVVMEKPILFSELERAYSVDLAQSGRQRPDSATQMVEMRSLLERYIDNEVLLYLADAAEVRLDDIAVEHAIDNEITEKMGTMTEAQFTAALRREGIGNIDAYRTMIGDNIRRSQLPEEYLRKMRREARLPVASVPDSLVEQQVALARASAGRRPATIGFRQIFVRTVPSSVARVAARARADSVLATLQRGEDFAALATQLSMDSTTNKNGGELPWAPRGRFEPAFDHWAWRLEPGQFSPVIETSYGFHIVKVDRKQAAEVKTRHILIQPAVDSADAALARARADSAAAMLRQGVPFDSVADRFNDPTANDRFVPVYQLDSLPPNYAQAVAGLKTGDITAPFETPDTRSAFPTHAVLAIASAEEERPYSDEEIRAVIRRQMQDVAATRAFIDKMRKQLYIRTMM